MPTIFGPISLGEFIDKLNSFGVEFDHHDVICAYSNAAPYRFTSYRGWYEHLALTRSEKHRMTLATFRNLAKGQVGIRHEGYKGGHYLMTLKTPVWLSEWGENSGYGVTDVVLMGHQIGILSEHFDL